MDYEKGRKILLWIVGVGWILVAVASLYYGYIDTAGCNKTCPFLQQVYNATGLAFIVSIPFLASFWGLYKRRPSGLIVLLIASMFGLTWGVFDFPNLFSLKGVFWVLAGFSLISTIGLLVSMLFSQEKLQHENTPNTTIKTRDSTTRTNTIDVVDKNALISRVFNFLFSLTLLLWPLFLILAGFAGDGDLGWGTGLFFLTTLILYPLSVILSFNFSSHFRQKNMPNTALYISLIPLPILICIIGAILFVFIFT